MRRSLPVIVTTIIMETVQGEGGIHPAESEFLEKIRGLCTEKDILMICDEIQCGMGRTGTMYAYEQYGIKPDIVTTAKAMTATMAMSRNLPRLQGDCDEPQLVIQ